MNESYHCDYCANKPLPPYLLKQMTPAQVVSLLPVCPQCNRHQPFSGDMCDLCRDAIKGYEGAVYHSKAVRP